MATALMMPCADAIVGDRFDFVDKKSKLGPVESSIHMSAFVANTDCEDTTQSLVDLMTYGGNITKQQVAECLKAGLRQGRTLESLLCETNSDGCSPLLLAARKRETSALVGLLVLKADANCEDPQTGWSPLMHAVVHGDVVAVKALVAAGADLDRFSKDGWNPLSTAVQHSRDEIADVLLDAGASMDIIKRRHGFAHEQYLEAQKIYHARRQAMVPGVPYAFYVHNASEYV
jgi:hypothetical protein